MLCKYKIVVLNQNGEAIFTKPVDIEPFARASWSSLHGLMVEAMRKDEKNRQTYLELQAQFLEYWDKCPDLTYKQARAAFKGHVATCKGSDSSMWDAAPKDETLPTEGQGQTVTGTKQPRVVKSSPPYGRDACDEDL